MLYRNPALTIAYCLLLVWLLLFSSCTWTGSSPALPSVQNERHTYSPPATGSVSGTVVIGDTQFPESPEPLFAHTSADFSLERALWSAPIFYDQHFQPRPDQLTEVPLPENGDVLDSGRTIIMHLRHDLYWSDGQPLLAHDFLYWWQLNQNPDTGAISTSGYDQIERIETPDDFTVILHLKHAYGPYLLYLPYAAPFHAWGKLQPLELQNRADIYAAPQVTDGPYRLQEYQPRQQRYLLKPALAYHSSSLHGPFLAQLIYQGYADASELSRAVRMHRVQVAQGFLEDDLPRFSPLPPDLQILTAPAAAYEHLDFNNTRPFFQDLRVRRALRLVIDPCALLRTILHTTDCSRRTDQVEPPPSPVFDPAIKPTAYDPVAARKLLAEAGWSPDNNGRLQRQGQVLPPLSLVLSDNSPLRLQVARAIRQAFLLLHIQVQLKIYPLEQFFGGYTRNGVLATGAYDLSLFAFANSPDPDDEYTAFHSSQIPTALAPDLENYARVKDPLLDRWLAEARDTTAFATRRKLYQQFLARLADQVYILPLYTGISSLVVSRSLHNVIPQPELAASTWNVSEWWMGKPAS